jgi:hypothetical protein
VPLLPDDNSQAQDDVGHAARNVGQRSRMPVEVGFERFVKWWLDCGV